MESGGRIGRDFAFLYGRGRISAPVAANYVLAMASDSVLPGHIEEQRARMIRCALHKKRSVYQLCLEITILCDYFLNCTKCQISDVRFARFEQIMNGQSRAD